MSSKRGGDPELTEAEVIERRERALKNLLSGDPESQETVAAKNRRQSK